MGYELRVIYPDLLKSFTYVSGITVEIYTEEIMKSPFMTTDAYFKIPLSKVELYFFFSDFRIGSNIPRVAHIIYLYATSTCTV